MDWQLAHRAACSPQEVKNKVRQWLVFYAPELVISENLSGSFRKGRKAQGLILAIKQVVDEVKTPHVEIERSQPFANKYEQIDRLCDQFPQMTAIQPKHRRIFDAEPPYITIFEALAMARQYIDGLKMKNGQPPSDLPT